jgi:hypothetical protein
LRMPAHGAPQRMVMFHHERRLQQMCTATCPADWQPAAGGRGPDYSGPGRIQSVRLSCWPPTLFKLR